ncbi:DUF6494 family protein [Thioalkalivibrio paradoxus]|uniref:Uncharacterized protein n=1 Tax=Thioalkalivibrio paradoxus ARh 1 TaxID=713585 RepID=W0DF55_9GAMM|nr:DUF6494 family protein [Thioalkalivibrio paradoxus]AHE97254.1 hypothetical protein THITH_02090 [Thioalkalivibrio paradoxus ARh 1]
MNEETLNLSLRAFLKRVGINCQREIETAVRKGLESGALQGNETLPVKITLEFGPLDAPYQVEGEISLE